MGKKMKIPSLSVPPLPPFLDASEVKKFAEGMKDGQATLYLLRVTGIASNRHVVLPLNRKYLSKKFIRKTNPKCISHFVFFLTTQLQTVSQMPGKYSILLS